MTTTFVAPYVPSDDARTSQERRVTDSVTRPALGVHGGIPNFFRAACHTAAQGGSSGYASAGWHLANSLGTQLPYDLDEDEWAEEIEGLQTFAAEDDGRAIWDWFVAHFPKAMTLVPAQRRDRFVEGVRRAWEEGRINA